MNTRVFRLLVTVIVLACAACGREGRAPEAPLPAAAPAFDVARAASDPVLLGVAVARSPRELFPSFRLRATSRVAVVEDGKPLESLDEEALVERAPGGALHAYYGNSREQGRELYASGGQVWVRPRYGKFHRRAPAEPDEAERVADETGGTLAAYLELVLPGAVLRDAGAATAAGRPGRKVILARAQTPPAPRADLAGWRRTATVEALDGELILDEATGAVLAGRLAARVGFTRDGRALAMTLAATHSLEAVGGALAITPPPDSESSPTPQRSTEMADRDELLGGLAPPARKARTQP